MKSECYICGAPINSAGRDTPIYCNKHMGYAKRDAKVLQDISLDATFALTRAILQRARDDYILNVDNQQSDARVFFRSNWAQVLTNGELDPDRVLAELDRRIYELDGNTEDSERTER